MCDQLRSGAPRSRLYSIYAALADAFHWQHESNIWAEEGWIDFAAGVQRSLETPLQDAISGPERPEFNSGFSHRGSRGVGTSSGQSRTLAWPSLGHPPPKLSSPCARATRSSPQE